MGYSIARLTPGVMLFFLFACLSLRAFAQDPPFPPFPTEEKETAPVKPDTKTPAALQPAKPVKETAVAPNKDRKKDKDPKESLIYVQAKGGDPVKHATVVILAKDGSGVTVQTDEEGHGAWDTVEANGPYTVIVACKGYRATSQKVNKKSPVKVTLRPAEKDGGSLVFVGGGTIPGLVGSVSPQLDQQKGLVLFAAHCKVNGVGKMPVPFRIGVPMLIRDNEGNAFHVNVLAMSGTTSLVEYARAK